MKIAKTLLSVVVLTLFAFAFAGSGEQNEQKGEQNEQKEQNEEGNQSVDYEQWIKDNMWGRIDGLKHVNSATKVNDNPVTYKIECEIEIQGLRGIQHGFIYFYDDGYIDNIKMLNDWTQK